MLDAPILKPGSSTGFWMLDFMNIFFLYLPPWAGIFDQYQVTRIQYRFASDNEVLFSPTRRVEAELRWIFTNRRLWDRE
jgi:hypothetical protein